MFQASCLFLLTQHIQCLLPSLLGVSLGNPSCNPNVVHVCLICNLVHATLGHIVGLSNCIHLWNQQLQLPLPMLWHVAHSFGNSHQGLAHSFLPWPWQLICIPYRLQPALWQAPCRYHAFANPYMHLGPHTNQNRSCCVCPCICLTDHCMVPQMLYMYT